jgi:GNAT superfamily N-acetyltransferase
MKHYKLQSAVTIDELKKIQKELKPSLSEQGMEDLLCLQERPMDYAEFVYESKQLVGVLLGQYCSRPQNCYEMAIGFQLSVIDLIIVDKKYQNEGIGTKLIKHFISKTKYPVIVYTCSNYGYYIYEKLGFTKHKVEEEDGVEYFMYEFTKVTK